MNQERGRPPTPGGPGDEIRKAGFDNVDEVVTYLGVKDNGEPVVSKMTLFNWHKNKPLLFEAVILGLAYKFGKRPTTRTPD